MIINYRDRDTRYVFERVRVPGFQWSYSVRRNGSWLC